MTLLKLAIAVLLIIVCWNFFEAIGICDKVIVKNKYKSLFSSLPKEIENEIYEFVRGDRKYWKNVKKEVEDDMMEAIKCHTFAIRGEGSSDEEYTREILDEAICWFERYVKDVLQYNQKCRCGHIPDDFDCFWMNLDECFPIKNKCEVCYWKIFSDLERLRRGFIVRFRYVMTELITGEVERGFYWNFI